MRSCGGQVSTADLKIVVRRQGYTKVAPRKVAQHDKDNIACTNLATTYHAALGDSSKDPLSSDSFAPTTIPSRSDGLRLGKNRSALVGDAHRSPPLLAPTPTHLAPPPWRTVGAGEGCAARGGA